MMNVADIMTQKPVTIDQNDTLRKALELMEQVGCHHLPVLGFDGHLVGIISDRDCRTALNSPYILREKWQDDDLVNKLLVRAMMTPAPIVVEPNMNAAEAARLMIKNHISSLPVMRSETLVGIVTTSDILIAFMNMAEGTSPLERASPESKK
jgi:acetoin utilization protein AcuB